MRRASRTFDRNLKSEVRLSRLESQIEFDRIRKKRRVDGISFSRWMVGKLQFEFQLFIGGKKFPRTKFMTPQQVKKENRDFADKLYMKLDTNPDARLSFWKSVDPNGLRSFLDRLFEIWQQAKYINPTEAVLEYLLQAQQGDKSIKYRIKD